MLSPLQERELARWYELIPHPVQLALIKAIPNGIRFPVVPAGRRCLERGTLVATPKGAVPIEQLSVGDVVIGYNSQGEAEPTLVAEVFNNGWNSVFPLASSNKEYLAATANHKLWACNEALFDNRRKQTGANDYKRCPVVELTKRNRVRREYCFDHIDGGSKHVAEAYALGALLGDGCCRENKTRTGQNQTTVCISSPDDSVPTKIADLLSCGWRRKHPDNCTYSIDIGEGALFRIPFYREWASGRYAHEKIADIAEIDTWDKSSALSFLAGVIDTDGSVRYKSPRQTEATISIAMQAKPVLDACEHIVFKFFQERMTRTVDTREKYKNGPVHIAATTSNLLTSRVVEGLRGYSLRCANFDTSTLVHRNVKADRIGLQRGTARFAETFDIRVANDTNLYVLHHGGIVTSNSGKTERFKRFLAKQALDNSGEKYFAAAPTRDQAKKIFWDDLKMLTFSSTHDKAPSESELKIYIPNGSEIHVLGLDKPQRIEGINWTGGGIDEIADIKEAALEANIMPALNTVDPRRPDYRAWCWFLGVPDGLNHYYRMAKAAELESNSDYALFHWKSAEILPPDIIEAAKRTMSAKQFSQEYEASFQTATGRIYEDYSKANYTDSTIAPHEQLHWAHDQNYTPLSSSVSVIRNESDLYILDEIVLTSAVSRQSAEEFVEKFKDHKNKHVYIYGDPAGRAGEKHGHASDYREIEDVLRKNDWLFTRRVAKAHPAIKDRQNAVRAKVLNAAGEVSLYINPETASWCHEGLSTVQYLDGSTFQEDQRNPYQHITTAIGYQVNYLWPVNESTVAPVITPGMF